MNIHSFGHIKKERKRSGICIAEGVLEAPFLILLVWILLVHCKFNGMWDVFRTCMLGWFFVSCKKSVRNRTN